MKFIIDLMDNFVHQYDSSRHDGYGGSIVTLDNLKCWLDERGLWQAMTKEVYQKEVLRNWGWYVE